jgi:type 1 glutamine amidotransferase
MLRDLVGSLALVCGLIVAAAGCSGRTAVPTEATPLGPAKRLLIVTFTNGFHHSSIPVAEATLQAIGTRSGLFTSSFCRTQDEVLSMLTPSALASYDAVFFANTTGTLGIRDLPAFLNWVSSGHGFLGAHSAADTYHESADYIAMLGGEFLTHGDIAEGDIRVDDPADAAVAHLAPRFRITDELYRFTRFDRSQVHVLLSMDRTPDDGVGAAGSPADLPVAWRRTYGAGRVFYTALGPREEVWQDARFQQHLLGALRFALGS